MTAVHTSPTTYSANTEKAPLVLGADSLWKGSPIMRSGFNEGPLEISYAAEIRNFVERNPCLSFGDLLGTTPNPNDNLLGDRYLCRGSSLLLVGPSGVGKSSASMLMDLAWSAGRTAFGIKPVHPLKVLCIQAENDSGDMHEMAKGASEFMQLNSEEIATIEQNFHIVCNNIATGEKFLAITNEYAEKYKPDLIHIDPALAYLGCDTNSAEQVGNFLRSGLNKLMKDHNCGIVMNHHTAKPSRDSTTKRPGDAMYMGSGSAEFANWPRAIIVIDYTAKPGVFRFTAAKRGDRIGWQDANGPCKEMLFSHSPKRGQIAWHEVPRTEADEIMKRKGRKGTMSNEEFIDLLPFPSKEDPDAALLTMQELENAASAKRLSKDGLAKLRSLLDKEGKIYVQQSGGRSHAIRVGRIECKEFFERRTMAESSSR